MTEDQMRELLAAAATLAAFIERTGGQNLTAHERQAIANLRNLAGQLPVGAGARVAPAVNPVGGGGQGQGDG